uniref:N-acetyltransferase domain-containing protein n=1 Tax=Panagrolaimus sp. JU765 TaxID=591449 RepID=A0AC34RSJ4_9BILA
MMEMALYTQEGDVEQAALRIAELPSVGIFKQDSNELVAFEYNDGLGLIAHQFVYPEYRNQGFGKIVEIIVSQKNLTELGIRPAKTVAVSRSKAQTMTRKSGFWTQV